jgi:hypothetical protein
MKFSEAFKPAVTKKALLFMAGFVWLCVGTMLLSMAISWFAEIEGRAVFLFVLPGFLLALMIHHFGFLKIVDKNIDRIRPMTEKRCLFAFITWKSYLIILVMVLMGYLLRHSPIPNKYLAIIYSGIGLALILSSIRYIRAFFRELRK